MQSTPLMLKMSKIRERDLFVQINETFYTKLSEISANEILFLTFYILERISYRFYANVVLQSWWESKWGLFLR
jgi:hypothetical protein